MLLGTDDDPLIPVGKRPKRGSSELTPSDSLPIRKEGKITIVSDNQGHFSRSYSPGHLVAMTGGGGSWFDGALSMLRSNETELRLEAHASESLRIFLDVLNPE